MKYFQNKLIRLIPQKAVLIFLASVVVTGCVPGIGGGTAQVKPEGEFMAGAVVPGFPPLPIFPKAKVIESYGTGQSFGANLTSNESLAKVFEFYNGAFTPLGWTAVAHKKSDTNIVYDIKNDKYAGQLIINTASDGKSTAITVAVSTR